MSKHKPFPTVVCNLGLGDLFVLSGGIVYIASICGGVRVPVLDYNYANAKAIFINHPEVELFLVTGDRQLRDEYRDEPSAMPCYWIRVEGVIIDPTDSWDIWMYKQLHVDFRHRYDSCPVEAAIAKFSQIEFKEPYYLVHDDQKRGFNIIYPPWHPVIRTYRMAPVDNLPILCWGEAIRAAKELHFMDSCGMHFANCMYNLEDPHQDRFYWHRYPRLRKPIWHDVHSRYHWNTVG